MYVFGELIRAQLENLASDPASPSQGHSYYNTQLGRFKVYNSTSARWDIIAPQIAYVENGDAESSLIGWATYADAAGSSPVDGTGGSPAVTLAREVAQPLRGGASFLLSKDAADRQGEGTSYDIVIDTADQGESLTLELDYLVGGGFVTGGSSDLLVYLYDVTNAGLIALSTSTIDNASGRFMATFTAASNSKNYRVILHVATTNAAAWTFKFDRVSVTPNVPIQQTVSAIPTGSVLDYAGGSAPTGYLMCDGSAVSRASYASLFATVGTSYGSGDGSTTFNIPDLRGRIAVGRDDLSSGVPSNVLLHSNFQDSTFDADFSIGSPTNTIGGSVLPTIVSNNGSLRAFMASTGNGCAMDYASAANSTGNIGSMRFEIVFGYTGTPTGNDRQIVKIGNAGTHPISLTHKITSGNLELAVTTTSGTTVFTVPGYAAAVGVHEVLFCWDTNKAPSGEIYLFLDRILQNGGAPYTFTSGTRVVDGSIVFGQAGLAGICDFYLDDISTYDEVLHTVDYPVEQTEYITSNPANRVTTGESGIDGTMLGASGGEETHQLVETELPSHVHGGTTAIESQSHDHSILGGTFASNTGNISGGADTYWDPDSGPSVISIGSNNQSHVHTFVTNAAGSDETHQNMPPSLIVNKIIKT